MGWIGYITSYMFYFTVSRDGKFSNMLRNDPKVERKKGSSLLALRLSFLSTWQVSYCASARQTYAFFFSNTGLTHILCLCM